MTEEEAKIAKWAQSVQTVAAGVTDPGIVPRQRRRYEKELAELVTPFHCRRVAVFIQKTLQEKYGNQA